MPLEILETGLKPGSTAVRCRNVRPWKPVGSEFDTEQEFHFPCHMRQVPPQQDPVILHIVGAISEQV